MESTELRIESNDKFTIEQDEDIFESLTCGMCVQQNMFRMYINTPFENNSEVVKIKENSNFCCRCLLHPRCRAFTGEIKSGDNDSLMFYYDK